MRALLGPSVDVMFVLCIGSCFGKVCPGSLHFSQAVWKYQFLGERHVMFVPIDRDAILCGTLEAGVLGGGAVTSPSGGQEMPSAGREVRAFGLASVIMAVLSISTESIEINITSMMDRECICFLLN